MIKTPAHKQTDPAKKPGQLVTSPTVPVTSPYGFDRHPYLKTPNCEQEQDKGDRTLADYINRIKGRE